MQDSREMLISISTDGDDHELDALRLELSEELSMLPVNAVDPARSGEAPPNTRGLDVIALGKLVVEFGPDVINAVANTIRSWLQRSVARSVELTINGDSITLNKASAQDQERLLNLFIERHLSS
jgi:hypothetical protein